MNLNESPVETAKRLTKRMLRKVKRTVLGHKHHVAVSQPPEQAGGKSNRMPIMEIVPTRNTTKIIGANWLAGFIGNQHSEHGEDGIINKIFEIMPPTNKWVCEFGAHEPEIISNTWQLINKQGWHAVLIEGASDYFAKLQTYYKNNPNVHCLNNMVSFEGDATLDRLLTNTPAPIDLDFMVIDIDGNDYHVWEAIQLYRAKLVMIEFNASIPVDVSFKQARDLSVNQGSSLRAMVELAATKGYKLIAVTSWNAFFVQDAYYSLFFKEQPPLEDMYVFPAKHPIWMRAFQLYDGTIMMAPWNQMLWHNINLHAEDYQALPSSLRYFSRELSARKYVMEKNGQKTPLAEEEKVHLKRVFEMPGNVLSQFAKNVTSEHGEDGILDKIIQLISVDQCYFVEVGAGDGVTRSKSRHLRTNHVWDGLMIERETSALAELKKQIDPNRIKLVEQPLTLAGERSLDHVLAAHHVPHQFGVFILNTFGMEYYLWESLQQYTPKIVMAQFNPTIPNDVKFVQPNDFNVHQGCSLRALCDLAHYKGYELVAVTLETAFFVRRESVYRLFEAAGFKYADLDEMFSPMQMSWFQLYDGTLVPGGLNRLLWHGIRIDEEKIQVVPKALRTFHQFAESDYKKFFYRI